MQITPKNDMSGMIRSNSHMASQGYKPIGCKWVWPIRVISLRSNEAPHQEAWTGLQKQAQTATMGKPKTPS